MFCVDSIENFFEIRSAEMCFRFQAGENAPARHALEVLLTNILQTNETKVNRDMESKCWPRKIKLYWWIKAVRICRGVPSPDLKRWYSQTLLVDTCEYMLPISQPLVPRRWIWRVQCTYCTPTQYWGSPLKDFHPKTHGCAQCTPPNKILDPCLVPKKLSIFIKFLNGPMWCGFWLRVW